MFRNHVMHCLTVALVAGICTGLLSSQAPCQEAAQPGFRPDLVAQLRSNGATSLAFSPDGRWLANSNRLWDLRSRKLVRTFLTQQPIGDVAFSSDGRLLAGLDRTGVIVWELGRGVAIQTLRIAGEEPTCLCFRPGSGQVAVGYKTGALRFWAADSGHADSTAPTDLSSVAQIAFDGAGRLLAIGGQSGAAGRVALLDLASQGKRTFQDPVLTSLSGLAIDSAGTRLAVADKEHGLIVWDVASDAVRARFPRSGQVRFTPDGRTLLNLRPSNEALDGQLTLGNSVDYLDPDTAQRRRTISEGWGIFQIAIDPQGQFLAAAGFSAIGLYDLASGSDVGTLAGYSAQITALAYSHTGATIALRSDNNLILWDLRTARPLRNLSLGAEYGESASSLFFAPGDDVIYAATKDGIRAWRVADGSPLQTFRKVSDAQRGALDYYDTLYQIGLASRDGSEVFGLRSLHRYTDQADLNCSKIDVWDRTSLRKRLTFGDSQWDAVPSLNASVDAGLRTTFYQAALRADAKRLATVRFEQTTVEIWDVASGRLARTLDPHSGQVTALAYSPTENLLAVGFASGSVQLWRDDGGRPVGALQNHTGAISALAFTPDGKLLLSGGDDQNVVISSIATQKPVRTLGHVEGFVAALAVAPDGSQCIAAGSQGSARLWRLAEGGSFLALTPTLTGEVVATTPEGYYTASRDALKAVAFRVGGRAYPFEQFDLLLDRPDRVLAACGGPDSVLLRAYQAAYNRRKDALHLSADAVAGADLPEISITPPASLATQHGIAIPFTATSARHELARIVVTDNGVPLAFTLNSDHAEGSRGLSLLGQHRHRFDGSISMDLNAGENRLAISAFDDREIESLRQTVTVHCTMEAQPRVYVAAVGVSHYKDDLHNLASADKDAQAIADLLGGAQAGTDSPAQVRVLKNTEATHAAILQLRTFLAGTGPDDTIVLFFAGHGLLDTDGTYYFAPYDVDFGHPQASGLRYEEILGLLDGIGARRKLLLLDTCHAGELDPAQVQIQPVASVSKNPASEPTSKSQRGTKLVSKVTIGAIFDLQQELFADLRHDTGATVIAAARAAETAGENPEHGIFTQCVLDGLKGAADRNHDGSVTVTELFDYVTAEVAKRTANGQSPVTREENLDNDFEVIRIAPH